MLEKRSTIMSRLCVYLLPSWYISKICQVVTPNWFKIPLKLLKHQVSTLYSWHSKLILTHLRPKFSPALALVHVLCQGPELPVAPSLTSCHSCHEETGWGGWGVDFEWRSYMYSESKSSCCNGQSIPIIYIRERCRNNSFISSGCLCFCGTIQPPQVAVLINRVWAGVKPLLASQAHIWKRCHLHRLP